MAKKRETTDTQPDALEELAQCVLELREMLCDRPPSIQRAALRAALESLSAPVEDAHVE